MIYRIKLKSYNYIIWLLNKVIWVHDVFFTQVSMHQLRVWIKMKEWLTKLKTARLRHERDKLQEKGLNSWD